MKDKLLGLLKMLDQIRVATFEIDQYVKQEIEDYNATADEFNLPDCKILLDTERTETD